MQNNIILSEKAVQAINALRHKNGTFGYYAATLDRLHSLILHQSDELGMSDTETLRILRVLDAVRSDLAAIAGPVAAMPEVDDEDLGVRVNEIFAIESLEEGEDGPEAESATAPSVDE